VCSDDRHLGLQHFQRDSIYTRNTMSYSVSNRSTSLVWDSGRMMVIYHRLESPLEPLGFRATHTEWSRAHHPNGGMLGDWRWWDAGFSRGPSPYGMETRARIAFRLWPIALLLAILPAMRLWRWKHPRPGPPVCSRCGYDLRATPQRCPECGTAAVAESKAALA
jgi:hypothetical protein